MRRSTGATEKDDEANDEVSIFSPGQDKKGNTLATTSSFNLGSYSSYWNSAASFLENVGDVVSQVGDYVAPLNDDEIDEDNEDYEDEDRNNGNKEDMRTFNARDKKNVDGECEHEGEDESTVEQSSSSASSSSTAATAAAIRTTPSEDWEVSARSLPVPVRKPPPPGCGSGLSAPMYDPRFTSTAATTNGSTDVNINVNANDSTNGNAKNASSGAEETKAADLPSKVPIPVSMLPPLLVPVHAPAPLYATNPALEESTDRDVDMSVTEMDLRNISLSSPTGSPHTSPSNKLSNQRQGVAQTQILPASTSVCVPVVASINAPVPLPSPLSLPVPTFVSMPIPLPVPVPVSVTNNDDNISNTSSATGSKIRLSFSARPELDISQDSLPAWEDVDVDENEEEGDDENEQGQGQDHDLKQQVPGTPLLTRDISITKSASININNKSNTLKIDSELEREREDHAEYRSSMKATLANMEEHMLQLQSRSEENACQLQSSLNASQAEVTALTLKLQNSQTEYNILSQQHSQVTDTYAHASAQLEAVFPELLSLREEVQSLRKALLSSEESLKEHEELLWKSKAENSELMYAMQCDKQDMERVVARCTQLEADVIALNSTATATTAAAASGTCETQIIDQEQTMNVSISSNSKNNNSSSVDNINSLATIASLQIELRNVQDRLENVNALHQNAIDNTKILQDDLLIERNDRADRDGITRQLQKAEQEKQQLQLVISQLRNSKRSNKDDIDTIIVERDALKEKLENLTLAWTRDSQALNKATQNAEDGAASVSSMHRALSLAQSKERELQQTVRLLQEQHVNSKKATYDLTVMVDTLQADTILLRQENERKVVEVSNLHQALRQQEADREGISARAIQQSMAKLKDVEVIYEKRLTQLQQESDSQLERGREELRLVRQRCEDESLMRRKAQLDLNVEKRTMQKTLENALSQITNSDSADSVDRQLMANLFVSYLQKGQPKEVLDLISRILGFNENQLEAVGMRVPKVNFIASLFDTIVGGNDKGEGEGGVLVLDREQQKLRGESLAELWVSFLEAEAGTPNSAGAGAGAGAGAYADAGAVYDSLASKTTPTKKAGRPMSSIGVNSQNA